MFRALERYHSLKKELDDTTAKLINYFETDKDAKTKTLGYIKYGTPSLTETLNERFCDVEEHKSSLDHCFESHVSMNRWIMTEVCCQECDDSMYHTCHYSGTIYTIVHEGDLYYRSLYEENTYQRSKPVFKKYVQESWSVKQWCDVDPILQKYCTVAQYGDVAKKATLTDENVRKGYDIDLQKHKFMSSEKNGRRESYGHKYLPEQNGMINVSKRLIEAITKAFIQETKMANITIVPYKLNIYREGDHFSDHKDTPEPNLVATIVLLISGKSSEMILENNTPWNTGNMLIMFPDVLHRVNPVSEYRETMTFKVYSKWQPTKVQDFSTQPLTEEDALIFAKFEQFVTTEKRFAVLMQGEYTIDDVSSYYANVNINDADKSRLFPYKGVDQKLATVMENFKAKYGYDVSIMPVVLKCYNYVDNYDCDNDYYERTEIKIPTENEDRSSGGQSAGEIMMLPVAMMEEFEIPRELQEKFQKNVSYVENIYTVGYGDKTIGKAIYERVVHNVHYGNEYRGTLSSTVYWNMVFYAVPRSLEKCC